MSCCDTGRGVVNYDGACVCVGLTVCGEVGQAWKAFICLCCCCRYVSSGLLMMQSLVMYLFFFFFFCTLLPRCQIPNHSIIEWMMRMSPASSSSCMFFNFCLFRVYSKRCLCLLTQSGIWHIVYFASATATCAWSWPSSRRHHVKSSLHINNNIPKERLAQREHRWYYTHCMYCSSARSVTAYL